MNNKDYDLLVIEALKEDSKGVKIPLSYYNIKRNIPDYRYHWRYRGQ